MAFDETMQRMQQTVEQKQRVVTEKVKRMQHSAKLALRRAEKWAAHAECAQDRPRAAQGIIHLREDLATHERAQVAHWKTSDIAHSLLM